MSSRKTCASTTFRMRKTLVSSTTRQPQSEASTLQTGRRYWWKVCPYACHMCTMVYMYNRHSNYTCMSRQRHCLCNIFSLHPSSLPRSSQPGQLMAGGDDSHSEGGQGQRQGEGESQESRCMCNLSPLWGLTGSFMVTQHVDMYIYTIWVP